MNAEKRFMRNEEFLTKLAKQYVKEAGEKYLLENEELDSQPTLGAVSEANVSRATPGLDRKTAAARRRQKWQQHRLTFMGVAASIIVIVIAGIAFLPEVMRDAAPDVATQMAPAPAGSAPWPAPAAPTAPPPPPAATPAPGAMPPPAAAPEAIAPPMMPGVTAEEAPLEPRQQARAGIVTGDDVVAQHGDFYAATAAPPASVFADEAEYDISYDVGIHLNWPLINFSQNMFNHVLATGEENAVISALSAYYALAMAAQGAAGMTLEEFDRLLGVPSRYLPQSLQNLTQDFTAIRGDTILNIAGSVWIRDDMTVNTGFNRTMEAYFGAPAYSRDFFAPETIPEINRWVYDNTEGLIDSIIDEFGPDDVMLLINALYFKGQWPETMRYSPGTFTTACGRAIDMDFLTTGVTSQFQVAVTPQYEAALLPYNCGRFGMLLIRPTDGTDVREFAAAHRFADILFGLQYRHAIIQMPGLDLEYEIELSDILQDMGLVSAFNYLTADFSELVYTDYWLLEISSVLQKVRIIVDRYGTEAAAVTAVIFAFGSSGMFPPPTELIFNTPYIYAIIDTHTGIPLFMGVVDTP